MSGWEILDDEISGASDRAFWSNTCARGMHGIDDDGFRRTEHPIPLAPRVLVFADAEVAS